MAESIGDLIGRLKLDAAQFQRNLGKAQTAIDGVAAKGKKANSVFSKMGKQVAAAAAGYLSFRAAMMAARAVTRAMTRDTIALNKAMGQVATLTDKVGVNFDSLTAQVQSLSTALPKSADDLGMGLYQTLSSGVSDASDAMMVLEASAKLASSGLVDTQSSVDAVTTVMNAYALSASEVTNITDSFFTTVKQGKITVGVLASTIGTAATSAALAGVSYDDLGASIATMTKLGVDAATTTTSLNRLFLSIVDGQQQTIDAAKELGIEWSTQALKAKGLAGFLNEVAVATGGDIDALTALGLDLRAARSLFVLAGVGAEEFTAIQEEFANKTGATEEAVRKTNATLEAQYEVIKNRVSVGLVEMGNKIIPGVISVLGVLADQFESTFDRAIRRMREMGLDAAVIAEEIRRNEEKIKQDRLKVVESRLETELGITDVGPEAGVQQFVQARAVAEAVARSKALAEQNRLSDEAVRIAREIAIEEERTTEVRSLGLAVANRTGQAASADSARRLQALDKEGKEIAEQAQAQRDLLSLFDERKQIEQRLAQISAARTPQIEAEADAEDDKKTATQGTTEALIGQFKVTKQNLAALQEMSQTLTESIAQMEIDMGLPQTAEDAEELEEKLGVAKAQLLLLNAALTDTEALMHRVAAIRFEGIPGAGAAQFSEGAEIRRARRQERRERTQQLGFGVRLPALGPSVARTGEGGGISEGASTFKEAVDDFGGWALDIGKNIFDPQKIAQGILTGGLSTVLDTGLGLISGAIGSLFGGGESETARVAREAKEALDRNTDMLKKNVAQMAAVLRGFSGADLTRASEILTNALSGDAGRIRIGGTGEQRAAEIEFLKSVAADLGLEWTNTRDGLIQLQGAIDNLVRESFQQFSGGFSLLMQKFSLLDITDPLVKFQQSVDFVSGLLRDDFAKVVSGLDATNIDAFIADFITSLAAGTFDLAQLGDISIDDFLQFLGFAEGALDGLADSARTASDALRNAPAGFKVSLERWQAAASVGNPFTDVTTSAPGNSGGTPTTKEPGEGGGGGKGDSFVVENLVVVASDPDAMLDELERRVRQQARRGGVSGLDLAVRPVQDT